MDGLLLGQSSGMVGRRITQEEWNARVKAREADEQRTKKLEAQAHTVSQATLRTEDLVVAFYQELTRLNPQAARELVEKGEYADVLRECDELEQVVCGDWSSGIVREEACWLLEELTSTLEERAPEGLYFGALEGDGAHFGFWVYQEEYFPEEVAK